MMKSSGRTPAAQRIVYIATSADGYIARAGGSVDWLDRPIPKGGSKGGYEMIAFAHR